MLNWSAIAAVADILAAVGVIASLLYLAVQVRHSTRQGRLEAQQVMVNELGAALQAQAQNAQLAAVVLKGLTQVETLAPVEKLQFFSHISHLLRLYEAVYYHREAGTLDEHIWAGFEGAMTDVMSYAGMRTVLQSRRHHLSSRFADYLAGLAERAGGRPIFGEQALPPSAGTA